ncbi:hypothetical protein P3X46_021076 [Hevea brasiliensis]|uniref:PUM-HD domain-containing protein n=1 Tax=Hevea brasiliensis TaxID=3981 RepID=A0ABQ9LGE5_HEVBR|nr:pumilio homolog 12 [Hevea brasiliensis]KAJ9166302.1 hypothetical protein P3X46_021076 [Hevea brasiliensis]
MEQRNNRYQFQSAPFEASVRHLNQRHRRPQTSSQNSCHDIIESLFSRLSVSHHNGQPSFLASYGDLFVGSALDHPSVAGQPISFQGMGQNLQNNGVNACLSMGLHDYVSYPDMLGSNIDFWDSFIPDVNGLLRADSSGFSNGSINGYYLPKSQNSVRSSLYNKRPHRLQESSNYLPLENLRGRILRFAKDQNGCRLLQSILGSVTQEGIDMVFLEVIDYVGELMLDPFGNYVVQKLVEVCSEEQRTQILLTVTKSEFQLVRICLNMHGTRAVQKLLERITSQQQVSVVMSALSLGAVALAKDMNGQHVIKHCLEHFSDENNKYLLNVVADNCFEIATDKSGCCILQQCVEFSKGEARDRLVAEITANALLLAEDGYGNYVVQHLLGLKVPQITANLLRQLEGSYAALACNKYGSNVVEKCLFESREEQSTQIIWELLGSPNASMLLVDSFGNYVIQSALLVSKGPVLRALLALIQINIPRMRSNIYGKKVLSRLRRKRLPYL